MFAAGGRRAVTYVLVLHISDGRITEGWELWTDQGALDEFWS